MVSKVTPDTMMSASRLPSIMGLSKYQTPNDELEYSINALKGLDRPDIGNESMAWGNTLEPVILVEAAKRLQLFDLVTDHNKAFFHEELPLCCSLDGSAYSLGQVVTTDVEAGIYVIGQDSIQLEGMGVIEAKLTAMDAEEIPPLWRGPIQLQAQMDIVKAKWGCIATLYRGTQLRLFLFAPHQGTLDRITQVTLDFQLRLEHWKKTGAVDYYPPMEGEKWLDSRGMYPATDEPVELDSTEAAELAQQISDSKTTLKMTEQEIAAAEDRLKELMGDCTKATAGGFIINWPVRTYKSQPEKVIQAKEAYSIRQSTLTIKEAKQ
jgi:predicted phage-related endonuclease